MHRIVAMVAGCIAGWFFSERWLKKGTYVERALALAVLVVIVFGVWIVSK